MADTDKTKTDPRGQLFDQLDDLRAGMLGVAGSGQHFQPMAHYLDRESESLWFITSSETDLVEAIGTGAEAEFCITSTAQDYYASVKGPIHISDDETKLDELWNKVAAAWFEGGRENAKVTLVHMPIHEAAVWASTSSAIGFALEIARANLSKDRTPDVGEHKVIDFRTAA